MRLEINYKFQRKCDCATKTAAIGIKIINLSIILYQKNKVNIKKNDNQVHLSTVYTTIFSPEVGVAVATYFCTYENL